MRFLLKPVQSVQLKWQGATFKVKPGLKTLPAAKKTSMGFGSLGVVLVTLAKQTVLSKIIQVK